MFDGKRSHSASSDDNNRQTQFVESACRAARRDPTRPTLPTAACRNRRAAITTGAPSAARNGVGFTESAVAGKVDDMSPHSP
jgi:hypothetical protein